MADHRTLDYRPHLDGIRALAVLAVFVFHSVPSVLSGGFIGVDVFFVLSGYLITLILLRQIAAGTPKLLGGFYVRRLLRLMPAALTLLVVVGFSQLIWGATLSIEARASEVRSATIYLANWNLIDHADDYFAGTVAASPLRHMWSLAVEEQFYLVWPLLLLLVWHLGRRSLRTLGIVTALITIASAVTMAVLFDPHQPSRAYYGTDSRAFQPFVGALLAIAVTAWQRRHSSDESAARTRLALVGGSAAFAALILASEVLSGDSSFYFRGGAVLVALAAALLIWGSEHAGALRSVLSLRPLVALGTISYGFYLWHWPIILWISPPPFASTIGKALTVLVQLLVTIAAATASYVLVERPIRSGSFSRRRARVFAGAAMAMALVVALTFVLPSIYPTRFASVARAASNDQTLEPCPNSPRPCVKYEPADNPEAKTVVVVGDSIAMSWDPAMKQLAEQYAFRYVQAAIGGCPLGVRLLATGVDGALHRASNFTCYEHLNDVYDEVISRWNPALVIATSWNEGNQHITDGKVVKVMTTQHDNEMEAALAPVVDKLTSAGAKLAFIAIPPQGPSINCLETSQPNQGDCLTSAKGTLLRLPINKEFADNDARLDAVVGVMDFTDVLCPDGNTCPLMIDGVIFRHDGIHLTGAGDRVLAPILAERLKALGVDLANLG